MTISWAAASLTFPRVVHTGGGYEPLRLWLHLSPRGGCTFPSGSIWAGRSRSGGSPGRSAPVPAPNPRLTAITSGRGGWSWACTGGRRATSSAWTRRLFTAGRAAATGLRCGRSPGWWSSSATPLTDRARRARPRNRAIWHGWSDRYREVFGLSWQHISRRRPPDDRQSAEEVEPGTVIARRLTENVRADAGRGQAARPRRAPQRPAGPAARAQNRRQRLPRLTAGITRRGGELDTTHVECEFPRRTFRRPAFFSPHHVLNSRSPFALGNPVVRFHASGLRRISLSVRNQIAARRGRNVRLRRRSGRRPRTTRIAH